MSANYEELSKALNFLRSAPSISKKDIKNAKVSIEDSAIKLKGKNFTAWVEDESDGKDAITKSLERLK